MLTFSAGAYEYDETLDRDLSPVQKSDIYQSLVYNHTEAFLKNIQIDKNPGSSSSLEVFDYRSELAFWNISYVALRDLGQLSRFSKDPTFSLVFINNEVAIFRVRK